MALHRALFIALCGVAVTLMLEMSGATRDPFFSMNDYESCNQTCTYGVNGGYTPCPIGCECRINSTDTRSSQGSGPGLCVRRRRSA
uniref:Putative secreted protein n=1 Tax=Amblyomma aureolatum TaxID=187763 RepID=A0A1E1WW78_9ACAR